MSFRLVPPKPVHRSFLAFGLYLLSMGGLLVAAPNLPLRLLGFPPAEEVWVRVAGMLVLFLAYYYLQVARGKVVDFYLWTVQARATVILFFTVFVLLGEAPAILILFGAIDLSFAIWTWRSLPSRLVTVSTTTTIPGGRANSLTPSGLG
jgi:hypothetical protein